MASKASRAAFAAAAAPGCEVVRGFHLRGSKSRLWGAAAPPDPRPPENPPRSNGCSGTDPESYGLLQCSIVIFAAGELCPQRPLSKAGRGQTGRGQPSGPGRAGLIWGKYEPPLDNAPALLSQLCSALISLESKLGGPDAGWRSFSNGVARVSYTRRAQWMAALRSCHAFGRQDWNPGTVAECSRDSRYVFVTSRVPWLVPFRYGTRGNMHPWWDCVYMRG